MGYNNCFCIAGPHYVKKTDTVVKSRYRVDNGVATTLKKEDPKTKEPIPDFEHWGTLSAEEARRIIEEYWAHGQRVPGDQKLRVSLWLKGAMYDDLHIFVMDFDKIDGKVNTNSIFFRAAAQAANKITRSTSGGYHMSFGVNKEKAAPLFDEMNLLQADQRKGFVNKKGNMTLEGENIVDFFCDAQQFVYEWEEWDGSVGLTDKTDEVVQLLRYNFEFKRSKTVEIDDWADAEGNTISLEGMDAATLKGQMSREQQMVFDDLMGDTEAYDPSCKQSQWVSVGHNIWNVFGDELGGAVWLYWSKRGENFQDQSCANTWNYIQRLGAEGKSKLNNSLWRALMGWKADKIEFDKEELNSFGELIAARYTEEERAALMEQSNREAAAVLAKLSNAEPAEKDKLFRGDKLELVVKEKQRKMSGVSWSDEGVRGSNSYLIAWRGAEYTVDGFFKAAFPDYKRFSKRCVFGDDVLRLSPNQRAKLQYDVLAARYGLANVDAADETALALFCAEHKEVSTFNRLLTRLNWKDGLAKMVNFGASLRADETAVKTAWSYIINKDERGAAYRGMPMTWDRWMDGIEAVACEAAKASGEVADKQVYIAVYYQNGIYMALPRDAADRLKAWVVELLAGHGAARPEVDELGEISDEVGFEVVYDEVKVVDNVVIKDDLGAADKERGKQKVIDRAAKALADYKSGDKITTKELKVLEYDKNAITRLVKNGVVKRIRNGLYEVI